MAQVIIISQIEKRINEYQQNTGATKTWIAKQMDYNSPQALDKAMKNISNSLEVYYRFAVFLDCPLDKLYSIKGFS